jgi:outer membrane protein assembly factor BamE
MRLLFSYPGRTSALVAALCLVIAGCASKNPLMDDTPVARAATAADTSTTASTPTASATGAQTTTAAGGRRFFGFLSPYRIDIQQGNFVSREMVSQLKEGMTREQVRFIMGTPMLTDLFHADRWDYPFRIRKGNGELTSSLVTIHFKENLLVRFDGADLPTEQEYISRIAGSAPATPSAKPKTNEVK